MAALYESIRESLLGLGPHHPVLRQAIRLQAKLNGFRLTASDRCLSLSKGNRRMLLPLNHHPQVPTAIYMWDLYFDTIEPEINGELETLDFSVPGLRRYKNTGISLWAPGMAEDDTMSVYTAHYAPQAGDIVWDVGAHAGATVYFFAQMVGPAGKVYAFEPDDLNYDFLLRNIRLHDLKNVVPIKKALAGETGTASFSMDGTQGAGLEGFSQCVDRTKMCTVETLSFQQACQEYGVPNFVKVDIEGAETDVVERSLPFIAQNHIHFAIETDHRIHGEFTTGPICRLFSSIGYEIFSSTEYGIQFAWAQPPRG
ncbi:MAG: FkbM family methyltransferase [Acidobacteriaceae bacterium]